MGRSVQTWAGLGEEEATEAPGTGQGRVLYRQPWTGNETGGLTELSESGVHCSGRGGRKGSRTHRPWFQEGLEGGRSCTTRCLCDPHPWSQCLLPRFLYL